MYFMYRVGEPKYYDECDWSKMLAEDLQENLTWKVFTDSI